MANRTLAVEQMHERVDYGLDAPRVIRNLLVVGTGSALIGILAHIGGVRWLSWWGLLSGSAMLGTGFLMVWGSKVGKRRLAERAIAALTLRGNERILDVGCGHGLLLIAAAKKLTRAAAIGIDIWSQRDQANNSPASTLRNAELEGVTNRVRLCDGDARALPFADASFDVVVSSLAIHNIATLSGRTQALQEIARVVKSGGRIAIIDISRTDEYARVLHEAGFLDVQQSGRSFMFLIPTRILAATRK
jgi:SAM-dependent methyltransferase